jgi:hypothetical protein
MRGAGAAIQIRGERACFMRLIGERQIESARIEKESEGVLLLDLKQQAQPRGEDVRRLRIKDGGDLVIEQVTSPTHHGVAIRAESRSGAPSRSDRSLA